MQRTLRLATALFIGWLALFSIGVAHALEVVTDHSKFPALQQEFKSGPDVTRTCLACHTDVAEEIMNSQHWRWEFTHPQSKQELGKLRVVNNYCTSVQSNLDGCASCHIGYGALTDQGVKNDPSLIDCLVCHTTTTYSKPSGLRGNVFSADVVLPTGRLIRGRDLRRDAQSVGATSRVTCGSCHFKGGGGDGVKHGDMDTSLEYPDRQLDVHMDADGLNFTCATCHQPDGHEIPGSRYAPATADRAGLLTCQTCHGQAPHEEGENAAKLNSHVRLLTCQTCHIPAMARGGVFTMTSWDWSTAGKLDEQGKQFTVRDDYGNKTYESRKGHMTYAENLIPDYIWFNGDVKYTLPSMVIDPSKAPIYINRFLGSSADGRSRIMPVKTMRGKQPFDPVTGHITVQQLVGDNDTAFWRNLNWQKAIEVGMGAAGLPFSGQVEFIETVSQWPVNHMVAPREAALTCADCHSRGGRLENVEGIYVVGQDHHPLLDNAAKLLALLALLGVLVHGALRIIMSRKH